MPRKTKEASEEIELKSKVVKKASKEKEKTTVSKAKSTKTTAKKTTAKKETKVEKATEKAVKDKAKKTTKKAEKLEEKPVAKKTAATKKTATKKTATKKAATEDKKEAAKKTTAKKAATTKKTTAKKASTTKKTTAKKSSTVAKTATKKKSTTKATAKATKTKTTAKAKTSTTRTKKVKVAAPTVVEYYDLPYKYNQTVVKVLYQNPTTLFVYWEISDGDIENYKLTYGENFFETTKPVLVVYNDTMNYRYEIDINDFANCWYFNINDSKCDYRVELIRRPIAYNEKITSEYIYITSSNKIESPNNKILFSTNEPNIVYFRNVKNNNLRKVNLQKLLEQLNLANKNFGFPIVRNINDLYKNIYKIEDAGDNSISLTNPSSGNPSSHSLSLKFI